MEITRVEADRNFMELLEKVARSQRQEPEEAIRIVEQTRQRNAEARAAELKAQAEDPMLLARMANRAVEARLRGTAEPNPMAERVEADKQKRKWWRAFFARAAAVGAALILAASGV